MNKANWLFREMIIYLAIIIILLFVLSYLVDSAFYGILEFLSYVFAFLFSFYAGSLYNEIENKK